MYNKQKCIAVGPENSILIPAGNAHRSRTYLVCLSNATWKCHGADALCDLRSRRLKCQGLLPNPPDGNFKQHTNNSARPSHLSTAAILSKRMLWCNCIWRIVRSVRMPHLRGTQSNTFSVFIVDFKLSTRICERLRALCARACVFYVRPNERNTSSRIMGTAVVRSGTSTLI